MFQNSSRGTGAFLTGLVLCKFCSSVVITSNNLVNKFLDQVFYSLCVEYFFWPSNIEDKLTRLIEDMKYIDKKMPYELMLKTLDHIQIEADGKQEVIFLHLRLSAG